jgi:type VI secretion system protein ImpH
MSLFEQLSENPHRFGFYQALRRLECEYPAQPRLGRANRTGQEVIRLGQDPSLVFAPASLASFRRNGRLATPRLGVHLFGLLGPNGPMPLHLSEVVHERLHNENDTTLADFLDLFHHRLLSLFYRTWAENQPTVSFDRPLQDRFGDYLGSLFGIGSPNLRQRDAMPDLAKLHFAGRFTCQTRHAEGLESMLQEFFQLPVRIEEFVGAWLELPADSRCLLDSSCAVNSLGVTALLGAKVWQPQQRFRIVLGPLGIADYLRMLPGGKSLHRLKAVVRNYLGDELEWELQLILRQQEIPRPRLDGKTHLGWTSWLSQEPLGRDGDDLHLHPCELRSQQQ